LLGSVGASLLFAKETDTTIHVDLPPDFDLPLSEESPEIPEESGDDSEMVSNAAKQSSEKELKNH